MPETKTLQIRNSDNDDFPYISQSAKELTGIAGWIKKAAFENRLIFFPDGQITVTKKDWPVLTASSILIASDFYKDTFKFLRGPEEGYISDHNPDGDSLFIFNLIPYPGKSDPAAYYELLSYFKKFCKRKNLRRIIVSLQSYFYPDIFLEDNLREVIKKAESGEEEHPLFSQLVNAGFRFVKIVEHNSENNNFSDLIFSWENFDFKEKTFYARKKNSARICAVQTMFRQTKNFNEYAGRQKYFAELAASYKSDFAIFPELNTLALLPEVIEPEDIPLFISKYTEEFLLLHSDLAVKHNLNIICGSTIIKEEDRFYNSFFYVDNRGRVSKQKKLHLSQFEKKRLNLYPGNKVEVMDSEICPVAVLSGYDIQFPEPSRFAADKGALIVFSPSMAFSEKEYQKISQTSLTRCIENQLFTVISGGFGKVPAVSDDYLFGKSAVLTPLDFVFSKNGVSTESEINTEDVIIDDLNIELLRRNRRFGESSNWIDRRTDLYKITWNDD